MEDLCFFLARCLHDRMYVREGTTSLRCGVANGTKRKLKTIGFIEAKQTPIVKCKYFCLDQSWQKKPQKSWIGWIFLKKLSRIMSNVFEFLVLITSHLPWSVPPYFFRVPPADAFWAPWVSTFFGTRNVLRRRTPLRTHLLKFLLNILSRWPSWDDLLTLFPPLPGNRFGRFFWRVNDGESHFTGIWGVGPKILEGLWMDALKGYFCCEIETNFLQHVLQDGVWIQDGQSCFLW